MSRDSIQRLESARAHRDGGIRMLEDPRYCIDVRHQINAVQGALDQYKRTILEEHLRTLRRRHLRRRYERNAADEPLAACFGGRVPTATTRHCDEGLSSM